MSKNNPSAFSNHEAIENSCSYNIIPLHCSSFGRPTCLRMSTNVLYVGTHSGYLLRFAVKRINPEDETLFTLELEHSQFIADFHCSHSRSNRIISRYGPTSVNSIEFLPGTTLLLVFCGGKLCLYSQLSLRLFCVLNWSSSASSPSSAVSTSSTSSLSADLPPSNFGRRSSLAIAPDFHSTWRFVPPLPESDLNDSVPVDSFSLRTGNSQLPLAESSTSSMLLPDDDEAEFHLAISPNRRLLMMTLPCSLLADIKHMDAFSEHCHFPATSGSPTSMPLSPTPSSNQHYSQQDSDEFDLSDLPCINLTSFMELYAPDRILSMSWVGDHITLGFANGRYMSINSVTGQVRELVKGGNNTPAPSVASAPATSAIVAASHHLHPSSSSSISSSQSPTFASSSAVVAAFAPPLMKLISPETMLLGVQPDRKSACTAVLPVYPHAFSAASSSSSMSSLSSAATLARASALPVVWPDMTYKHSQPLLSSALHACGAESQLSLSPSLLSLLPRASSLPSPSLGPTSAPSLSRSISTLVSASPAWTSVRLQILLLQPFQIHIYRCVCAASSSSSSSPSFTAPPSLSSASSASALPIDWWTCIGLSASAKAAKSPHPHRLQLVHSLNLDSSGGDMDSCTTLCDDAGVLLLAAGSDICFLQPISAALKSLDQEWLRQFSLLSKSIQQSKSKVDFSDPSNLAQQKQDLVRSHLSRVLTMMHHPFGLCIIRFVQYFCDRFPIHHIPSLLAPLPTNPLPPSSSSSAVSTPTHSRSSSADLPSTPLLISFAAPTVPPQIRQMYSEATELIQAFTSRLKDLIFATWPQIASSDDFRELEESDHSVHAEDKISEIVTECIQDTIFPCIHSVLMPLLRRTCVDSQDLLSRRYNLLSERPLSGFGCEYRFLTHPHEFSPASSSSASSSDSMFSDAIGMVCQISRFNTPSAKLRALSAVHDSICSTAQTLWQQARDAALSNPHAFTGSRSPPSSFTLAADDLVSILSYVLVRAKSADLMAEIQYMRDFLDRDKMLGREGYLITTVQVCLSHIEAMASRKHFGSEDPQQRSDQIEGEESEITSKVSRPPSILVASDSDDAFESLITSKVSKLSLRRSFDPFASSSSSSSSNPRTMSPVIKPKARSVTTVSVYQADFEPSSSSSAAAVGDSSNAEPSPSLSFDDPPPPPISMMPPLPPSLKSSSAVAASAMRRRSQSISMVVPKTLTKTMSPLHILDMMTEVSLNQPPFNPLSSSHPHSNPKS